MHLVMAILLCTHLLGGDPVAPGPDCGSLYQPAYAIDECVRMPAERYEPQPGDLLFFDDHHPVWIVAFFLVGAGRPMHAGMVVRRADGQLASLEAGYDDSIWVRTVPLAERLHTFEGVIWVRRRVVPLTNEESRQLTEFATAACTRLFGIHRLLLQGTPLRCRGPVRTYFVGKPKGLRHTFMCSECVTEALVYAGLIDAETARPAATYPRDLFFDESPNRYLNRHFKLAPAWLPPQLWTGCP